MSPEQAQGLPLDRRTDLWSLGVVLYEMVTRCRPFNGATAQQIVSEIIQKPAPAPTGAPKDLQRIIARCLVKDLSERYQSAAELARDLDRCAAAIEKAGRGFHALAAAARRPRVAVPALLALAAAIGLAAWALQAASMRRWAREEVLKWNFESDYAFALDKTGALLNSTSPDLRSFRATGGKLIQFHGWGDAAIPGLASIEY